MKRPDISEMDILENKFDIEAACSAFEDSVTVFYDFLKQVLLTDRTFVDLHISDDTKNKALLHLDKIKENLDKKISQENLRIFRVQAWEEDKKHKSPESDLFRVIVCGLYSEAEWVDSLEDAQDSYFSTILHSLYKLDTRYCQQFREFVETHPRMMAFRLIS
jgi:hypothetical protein